MERERNFTIDILRIILAVFIVALHSNPLAEFSELLSYFPSQVVSRIGVPFFAAVAGYYFFRNYNDNKYKKTLKRYFKTYTIWSVLMFSGWIVQNGVKEGIEGTIKYLMQTFCLEGWYHLWYMLAIIYTLSLVWIFSRFRNGLGVLYIISFLGLLLGILMFAYGNLFLRVSIFRNVFGQLDMDVNMQTQWLFIVVPFFMMGWRMNRRDSTSWVYKHAEMLLILTILGYLIEVIVITFTNVKASTTLCLFTYPIVYFLILVAFKYPHIGNETISHYCAGISSFMYFGHIAIVITMQNIGLNETPTFVIAVLLTVILGAIIVKLNHRILNGLL